MPVPYNSDDDNDSDPDPDPVVTFGSASHGPYGAESHSTGWPTSDQTSDDEDATHECTHCDRTKRIESEPRKTPSWCRQADRITQWVPIDDDSDGWRCERNRHESGR